MDEIFDWIEMSSYTVPQMQMQTLGMVEQQQAMGYSPSAK